MTISSYEHLGASTVDGLVIPSIVSTDIFTVVIRKLGEETTLKRGTLMDLSSGSGGDGTCVIHGTAAGLNETLIPFCILADNTVVGTVNNVMAAAYRRGHFVTENLHIASGASISDADKQELRCLGILLSSAIETKKSEEE